mmetsp:Transcript_38341/g.81717  ORF Transcript_38341/g.81717 Transcript_38341/m.81717 type:complete len:167 (-) Transcript_38341:178-678(-)
MELAKLMHPDRGGSEETFKTLSKAYALLSDPDRRHLYDELGSDEPDEPEHELDSLGEWRSVKLPFTAFKDRSFFEHAEKVGHLYVLLSEAEEGPFALELGGLKAGRCEKATLPAAGFQGSVGCEMGHCECGYYNGWRVEGFEGPLTSLPPTRGSVEFGHAEHHGEF